MLEKLAIIGVAVLTIYGLWGLLADVVADEEAWPKGRWTSWFNWQADIAPGESKVTKNADASVSDHVTLVTGPGDVAADEETEER